MRKSWKALPDLLSDRTLWGWRIKLRQTFKRSSRSCDSPIREHRHPVIIEWRRGGENYFVRPRAMTHSTFSSRVTSCNGLPDTAIRAAE